MNWGRDLCVYRQTWNKCVHIYTHTPLYLKKKASGWKMKASLVKWRLWVMIGEDNRKEQNSEGIWGEDKKLKLCMLKWERNIMKECAQRDRQEDKLRNYTPWGLWKGSISQWRLKVKFNSRVWAGLIILSLKTFFQFAPFSFLACCPLLSLGSGACWTPWLEYSTH